MRIMLIIVALCAGPALYAADGWDPPQYKSNLYMLSSTAPVNAEENGFAAPTLNDNLQNFFLGIPPTQDMHGVPAYYLAYDSYEIARATVRRLYLATSVTPLTSPQCRCKTLQRTS